MHQAIQDHEINYSNLAQLGTHQFHIANDKSAYHKQGLLNLIVKGHVTGSEVKEMAAELNYPSDITQVRHLVAYETYIRQKNDDKAVWLFTGYSLHPHYKTEVINGRAVVKEACFVELQEHDVACSNKPVPVTALFYSGLKSPVDSTEYLNALIQLDMKVLEASYGSVPAAHEITHYAVENALASFERPLFIEVQDKESGKFVFASLPSTDIESIIEQIKEIAATGLYAENREIAHSPDGRPFISLNYDSQNIDFNQFGDFGEREYLVQRMITAIKRGYALSLSQLDNDSAWFDFSRNVLRNGLFFELPIFTQAEHV